MGRAVLFLLVSCSFLFAANGEDINKTKEERIEAQIEKELEKEKKYARERTFYEEENYDFEGAEVNEESLSSIPRVEDDFEFNMDHVYD